MGLTSHYRLIPKHTACWHKARSYLLCRRECLCKACVPSWPFFRLLHVVPCSLFVWCVRLCESLLDGVIQQETLQFPSVLYSAPAANPFFMCPHLSATSSIIVRVSAPWRHFVIWLFFIFRCFSALKIVRHAHGHLMQAGLCGCGLMMWLTLRLR